MRNVSAALRTWLLTATTLTAPLNAFAAEPSSPSRSEPVMLKADSMDYERETGLVVATGHVEVVQGDYILLADKITYDQPNQLMRAIGNVSVLEPSGNVYFADSVELTEDMKHGLIRQFSARLADNSVFAASSARRVDENITELKDAVYSPCRVTCDDGTGKTPLWQIAADEVKIDQAKKRVTYDNARFELFGVPVGFTPFLAHPAPGAPNQSGLLTPELALDKNLGFIYRQPVYYAINPDRDLTVTPMLTTKEGPVLIGEYRQLYDTGGMTWKGSITRPEDRDALGNRTQGRTNRGHIDAHGKFDLTPDWNWGFDVRRTTDDTYLRKYDFSSDPLLTSKAYVEGFDIIKGNTRSYALAETLAFQGLTIDDDSKRSPFITPLAQFHYESEPLTLGSRFKLDASTLALSREEGPESRRISLTGSYTVPYVTEGGHMFEASAELRGDGYDVSNVLQPDGSEFSGTTGRIIPQGSVSWRYPLMRRFTGSTVTVEPVVTGIISPYGHNTNKIPNEDSAIPEFTDINLFSANRFAGLDRIESGPRVNYGIRSRWQLSDIEQVSFLLGQTYRLDNDPLFPISNDLTSRFSDYVGMLGATYGPLDLAYRFRLDRDDLRPQRNEVDANFYYERLTLGSTYVKLNDDPIIGNKEEILGNAGLKLTNEWTATTYARHDLERKQLTGTGLGFIFQNECLMLSTTINRDNTSDRDIRASTSFNVQVSFKNLD